MEYTFSTREKNGSVCLILSYKVGHKWRQKTKQGFKTKAEARRYQDTLLKQVQEIPGTAPLKMEKITLRDFLNVYLRDKREVLAYNTRVCYSTRIRNFGPLLDMRLRDIRPIDIQNVLNTCGKSPLMKKYMLVTIGALLNHAKNFYRLIAVNPAKEVRATRKQEIGQQKVRAFTRSEIKKLMSILSRRSLLKTLATVAVNTGMRFGEVGGLCWKDIDFKNMVIHVNQQWGHDNNGKYALVPLKTVRSKRTIPLSPALAVALKKWKQDGPEQINGMVFPANEICSAERKISYIIRKKFPGRSFHALRHTFATLLLQRTGDINLVANVLGDSVATVSAVYVNYTDDIKRAAAKAIATLF